MWLAWVGPEGTSKIQWRDGLNPLVLLLLHCPLSHSLHPWLHEEFPTISWQTNRRFRPDLPMVFHDTQGPPKSGQLQYFSPFLEHPLKGSQWAELQAEHLVFHCQSIQATLTKYHGWVTHKQKKVIAHSSGGSKDKIMMPAWSGSGKGHLLVCALLTSHCFLT